MGLHSFALERCRCWNYTRVSLFSFLSAVRLASSPPRPPSNSSAETLRTLRPRPLASAQTDEARQSGREHNENAARRLRYWSDALPFTSPVNCIFSHRHRQTRTLRDTLARKSSPSCVADRQKLRRKGKAKRTTFNPHALPYHRALCMCMCVCGCTYRHRKRPRI